MLPGDDTASAKAWGSLYDEVEFRFPKLLEAVRLPFPLAISVTLLFNDLLDSKGKIC